MIPLELLVTASIVLGANEAAGRAAEPGWPIVVSALFEPDSAHAVVPKTLTVRITDSTGRVIPVAFEAGPVQRDSSGWVHWVWLAGEVASGGLAPGQYSVTVDVAPADTTLWVSPGVLRVVEVGKGKPAGRARLLIQRALLRGRDEEAMAEVNRLVLADPTDEGAWVTRGDLYMAKDLPDSADASFNRALALHHGEALDLWQRKRAAFQRLLEKHGVLATPSGKK
jgi:hypothetical protein